MRRRVGLGGEGAEDSAAEETPLSMTGEGAAGDGGGEGAAAGEGGGVESPEDVDPVCASEAVPAEEDELLVAVSLEANRVRS
jgi:hypothetical protein